MRKAIYARRFGYGPYWARTSDLRLVEIALRQRLTPGFPLCRAAAGRFADPPRLARRYRIRGDSGGVGHQDRASAQTLDESPQPLDLALVSSQRLSVGLQRQLRVGAAGPLHRQLCAGGDGCPDTPLGGAPG